MPRRRDDFTLSDLIALLKTTPTWAGPVLAVAAFLLFRFVIPLLLPNSPREADLVAIWKDLLSMAAWGLAGAVLLAWGIAEVWKLFNRRLLDQQAGPSLHQKHRPEWASRVFRMGRKPNPRTSAASSSPTHRQKIISR